LSPVHCSPGREGGAWCFVSVTNSQSFDVESVSVTIRVADEQANQVLSQVATAPLDLLPAGASMPLAAYFPPTLPKGPLQTGAELLSSLPVFPDSGRYLPVELENLKVDIGEDGLEAAVRGEAVLGDLEQQAAKLWLVAVAYNQEGQVIGLRRWENESPLPGGTRQPFTFWVYTNDPEKIDRVEVLAEARPDQR
jgi:hypothetical protein